MGSYWRLSRNIQVIKECSAPLHFPACVISVWMPGVSTFPCSFPSLAVGSSSSCCWFISMSLVLHSTEIWLGTRQTPVEWRTTEPMDHPYFTWNTQASLSHVTIPFREAQRVHLQRLNAVWEAGNSTTGAYGDAIGWHFCFFFPPYPCFSFPLILACNKVAGYAL